MMIDINGLMASSFPSYVFLNYFCRHPGNQAVGDVKMLGHQRPLGHNATVRNDRVFENEIVGTYPYMMAYDNGACHRSELLTTVNLMPVGRVELNIPSQQTVITDGYILRYMKKTIAVAQKMPAKSQHGSVNHNGRTV
jgi:hypothetical protein